MLSKVPIDIESVNIGSVDKEILRLGIIGELDACNLYEQLQSSTEDQDIKDIFSIILEDEKDHCAKLLALLKKIDVVNQHQTVQGKINSDNIE